MTDNTKHILDLNGKSLGVGASVKLLRASEDLLSGLPSSDQLAIQNQVNKVMTIQSFDEYGHIELEFTDANNEIHFIWVEPKDVESIET